MDQDIVVRGKFAPHLPDCFQERHALDVADRPAYLDKAHLCLRAVRELLFGCLLDAGLDLVGDVGDDLDGLSQEIAPAFLVDDRAVHFAGRDVMRGRELDVEETLVVTEIEIDFAPVLEDKDLAMLGRVHRPGIDIQVRVDFYGRHPVPPVFQDTSDRGGRDPFSQAAHNTTGDKNVFHVISPNAYHLSRIPYYYYLIDGIERRVPDFGARVLPDFLYQE